MLKIGVKSARTTLRILRSYSSTLRTHLTYTVWWTIGIVERSTSRLAYSICNRYTMKKSHTLQYMHSRNSNILQRGQCGNRVFRSLDLGRYSFFTVEKFGERWRDRLCSNGHTISHFITLFHTLPRCLQSIYAAGPMLLCEKSHFVYGLVLCGKGHWADFTLSCLSCSRSLSQSSHSHFAQLQ